MGKAELAQMIDREGLDASNGARGRLRLAIPASWAREGGEIEITVPSRVTCARCDGGGCGGCERSGAHRTPSEPARRTLRLRLPERLGSVVTVRVVRPFGDDAGALDQLLVELSAGADLSPGVVRIAPPQAAAPLARLGRLSPPLVVALLAVLAAVAGLIASR
jgi:hypothetical protein